MKKFRRILIISISIIVLLTILITYWVSKQQLNKQALKEDIAGISSYTNEADYTIQQYKANKVTFLIMKIHLQYINKKVALLFDQMVTLDVPSAYTKDVNKTEDIALHLFQQISVISSSDGNKNSLSSEEVEISKIKKDINDLQKKYE